MATLSRLFIHPVKSMRGIGVSHALADMSGFAFDRIFMVTEPDGTFITARQFPQMVRFTPSPLYDGLHLTAPDGSSVVIRFADFAPVEAPTEVWGNHFTARIAPDDINRWLSGFFSRDVQLRWVGPALTRRVKRHEAVPLSFADGFPFLLTNDASLRDLQRRCKASVQMEQFRPNLVVTGADAWEEDTWKVIRIGSVVFDVVKPCSRCIFTTVSPEKGQKHPSGEPLKPCSHSAQRRTMAMWISARTSFRAQAASSAWVTKSKFSPVGPQECMAQVRKKSSSTLRRQPARP